MHLVVRKVVALSHIHKFEVPSLPPLLYPIDHDRTRDKALLIGIEYNPVQHGVGALRHPHRDVAMFRDYLVEHEGYFPENVKVLRDDGRDILTQPTKMNIFREIDRLVKDVQRGDRLVFVFAGHGCQTINRTGSEPMDQGEDPELTTSVLTGLTFDRFATAALTSNHIGFPVDVDGYPLPSRLSEDNPNCAYYQKKLDGVIVDNDLRERLVNRLPAGSQLVAFLETCHSETLLDLHSKRWKKPPVPAFVSKGTQFVARGVRSASFNYALPSLSPLLPRSLRKKKQEVSPLPPTPCTPRSRSWQAPITVNAHRKHREGGDATVISFSACGDDQVSHDLPVKHTMLSIVVEHLKEVAMANNASEDAINCVIPVTPRQLADHIRSTWNEVRAEAMAPIWKRQMKQPQKARKLKAVVRYMKKICGVQMPGVAILGGLEIDHYKYDPPSVLTAKT
ncbi:hypothetical protein PHLGIDRAFT_128592 [Phlebiopsis gigantea 11061_1 CR5-6]|uniref:Peptidase C14 caspase domain-containing protein n=1 Tax=Phlebiopsis gigantea (strain 11061_1 CR5-6) TaxID=745531 RepID=A0A0C3S972_PHLG1|nr:hypothetical protein PHLGIDRAFT_128592 [Phlebiopsis gigantea 11061_1 CR5-6]